MIDTLIQLGLNTKEANTYLLMLSSPDITASELSQIIGEPRTNTYMILDRLEHMGLVTSDNSKTKKFNSADPVVLKNIVEDRQTDLAKIRSELNINMPHLSASYRLPRHRPGVIYRQGLEGLKESLDDIANSQSEVLIFPSNNTPLNKEAYSVLIESLSVRKAKGIKSRVLLHNSGKNYTDIKEWSSRGMELRFSGESPYEGEVAIYDDKCVFTVYEPSLITTTITNATIAQTMRTVFENLWVMASPL